MSLPFFVSISVVISGINANPRRTIQASNKADFFDEGILGAKDRLEVKVEEIENVLKKDGISYYVPQVAQKNNGRFRAEFSFKDAAAAAGIGWFGKNDVIITEKYGPRVRLSAILIDHDFDYGKAYEKCMCPNDCNKCVGACALCLAVCPYGDCTET
ncbi:hypothetical protein [Butyrivibrio sp. LC3010]|uniref:hypothetical protein n=1 Tax=Butyrivibrio sp. LC3010 TaxID=1280680 RepID=UPI0012DBF4EB|nr:hypothetical protein [Butyrivibrio sp. LC3010]